MLEWQAKSVYGPKHDTWFGGRYLEKWADPRVLAQLSEVYPHYDEEDLQQALLANIQLFRWLAREIADHLDYPYPEETDRRVSRLIQESFGQA
jgi:aminoglycoside 6-adenylyltransferase